MFRPGEPDPIGAMINTIEAASDPDNGDGFRASARGQAMSAVTPAKPWKSRLNLGGSG